MPLTPFHTHLKQWGLTEWQVSWDRARKRLGCCHYSRRLITLSAPLLSSSEAESERWETFLHELAHALAFTHDKKRGHDATWKSWCLRVGATPERCASFAKIEHLCPPEKEKHTHALILKTTSEVVRLYLRKPRFKRPLSRLMLRGRPETLGQLKLIPWPQET